MEIRHGSLAPGFQSSGVGLLAHLGRITKAGYVLQRKDEAGRSQNGVVFSVDLWNLFSEKKKVLRAQHDHANDQLQAALGK